MLGERVGSVAECTGSRDCGVEPHLRHCVVSLSKALHPLLSTGSTQKDPSRHNRKIVDWDVKIQNKCYNISEWCYKGGNFTKEL